MIDLSEKRVLRMFEGTSQFENGRSSSECDKDGEKIRRFRAISEHLFSDLVNEAVILSLKNGKYYGINQVGASIWSMIQQASTLAEIESALMDEYAVDEQTCRAEVAVFIETMIGEGLIDVIDE